MRALLRTVMVAAVGLSLVACSGGNGNDIADHPQAALSVAADRTARDKTVKMTFTANAAGLSVATGSGAYDFKRENGRFKLSGALLSSFDIVLTPAKIYVRTPNGPKQWAGLTQAELESSGSGTFLSTLRSQIDPRQTLRNLGQTTKNVKVIGKEKVRGETTTHIRADVDLSDAAIAKAPADAQESLRQARQSIQADSYPIEVWLDNDGRVRKLAYNLTVQTATTTVVLELYDFGKDPHIVIPKPGDVKEGLN
ncbi:MAG: hypothetical protein QOK28_1318 [Actinomycetota bacterium]|jgi:hypothetical protein